MAKRKVRRQRRLERANSHTPVVTPDDCFADDCEEAATMTVAIDGSDYRVCAVHGELVQLQELRRREFRRQSGEVVDADQRRKTEEVLGLR